jgi:hypothetical protein
MGDSLDPRVAAAEARLDRLDDDRVDGPPDDVATPTDAVELSEGMHIEDADAELEATGAIGLTTDEILLELEPPGDPEVVDCIEAFTEAYNARDLDALLELVREDTEAPGLGNDLDHLPEAIEDLWERRPSTVLTRGDLDGQVLAVMWELGDGGRWWRVATVHFDDCSDGEIGVIEFSDDPGILEEVQTVGPDGDLDEGSRWEEWTDGALEEG